MRRLAFVLATAPLALAGCGGSDSPAEPAASAPARITVTSPAVANGRLRTPYTCDGAGATPRLSWSGVPGDAQALAVVVDDPDAPGGTFYHWVVLDLPATATGLDEQRAKVDGTEASNSGDDTGWQPACPPDGTHHYRFTVYALSAPTGLRDGADLDDALAAIDSTTVARGTLTATYAR